MSSVLNRSYIIIWTTFTKEHILAKTKTKQSQDLKIDTKKTVSQKGEKPKQPEKKKKVSKVNSGSISMYLAEIGKFEPLPPQREVELAIRIQDGDELAMK